jgi:hypothetical protein
MPSLLLLFGLPSSRRISQYLPELRRAQVGLDLVSSLLGTTVAQQVATAYFSLILFINPYQSILNQSSRSQPAPSGRNLGHWVEESPFFRLGNV